MSGTRMLAAIVMAAVGMMAALPAHAVVWYDSQGFEDAQPNPSPANAQHPNSPETVYQLGRLQISNDLQQDHFWPTEGGGGAEIKATDGNQYLELSTSANGRYRRYFGEPTQDSGNVAHDGVPAYRSHWLQLATLPTNSDGAIYLTFDRGGPSVPGALRGEVFVKPDGAGGYLVGVTNGTVDPTQAVFHPTALSLDKDYVVIDMLLADASTGEYTHTLWVDPEDELSVSVDATDSATSSFGGTTVGVNGFSPVQHNFFGNSAYPGTVRIDNLMIADNWAEIYQYIPQQCHVGDANGDGEVGIADLSALADNYGEVGAHVTWRMGDFNVDQEVGIADLSALADNYGWTGDPCDPDAMIVPEPVTTLLLGFGSLGLLIQRKRCRGG